MDIITSSFILLLIACLLFYIVHFNDEKDFSIPYAKYQSYPIVGHLFSFLRGRTKLLMECQQRYGNCFKIRVFNQRFILVLSSADWTTVIRNPSFYLPTDDFLTMIYGSTSNFSGHSDFDAETHRHYIQYLKNRDGLRSIVIEFVRRLRELFQQEKGKLKSNGTTSDWVKSGLLELSHRMIYQPSTLSLFGEIDVDSIEKDFQRFDNNFHYFYSNIPPRIFSWFFPEELKARSRLNESWFKNLHPIRESEFVKARKLHLRDNSDWIPEKDIGCCETGLLWASLGNTIPAVFWSLLYILRDPKAVGIIRDEINTNLPFCSLEDATDERLAGIWTPEQLNACVYLDSAVNEVLRIAGAAFLTRKCKQEVQLTLQDGRILTVKPNEIVAYFAGVTHVDPNLFPEPNKFIFDRFVNKNADTVPGYMPFGAGKNMCPGRFFAKNEMKICLAMLLQYMEYKLLDLETIPKQKEQRVGVGVAPPKEDIPIMYRFQL